MIEVQHLSKRYGNHLAVDDLSFTIEKGHIYGFLGPNGAGKSTTMNIITGCLAASDGRVCIDGHDIYEDPIAAKRCIGYLPEQPPLYQDMTPLEYLTFVARAKGVARDALADQLAHVMAVTGIDGVKNRIIRNLSKGYRQRVGVAQALLGDPQVIILDEPTVGLDPLQIIEIRDLIRTLGQEHTVVLSSHILSEVQTVCDRVMIIAHGRLVASDTPENLEEMFRSNAVIEVRARVDEAGARAALQGIDALESITYTPGEDGIATLQLKSAGDVDLSEQIYFAFADARIAVLQMNRQQASLEDIFLELTREDAPAQPAGQAPAEKEAEDESDL